MPKWLLLQMTRMGTTYSKEEKVKAFFLCYYTPLKNGSRTISNCEEISKCSQIVAKIRIYDKRKTPKSLFYNNLGVPFCGATRKRVSFLNGSISLR